MKVITRPRCGEKDFERTTLNNSRINATKYEYTYYVDSLSNLLPLDRQNITIRNAFYHWRRVISNQIHLHWSNRNPDFKISIVKRKFFFQYYLVLKPFRPFVLRQVG